MSTAQITRQWVNPATDPSPQKVAILSGADPDKLAFAVTARIAAIEARGGNVMERHFSTAASEYRESINYAVMLVFREAL